MLPPRRGSIPADISELRRDLFSRNNVNNKPRNRKKVLRRRSSGGPEMFDGSTDWNDNGMWLKWKREIGKRDPVPEAFVKRRRSLPIEMVAVSHAGKMIDKGYRNISGYKYVFQKYTHFSIILFYSVSNDFSRKTKHNYATILDKLLLNEN